MNLNMKTHIELHNRENVNNPISFTNIQDNSTFSIPQIQISIGESKCTVFLSDLVDVVATLNSTEASYSPFCKYGM
jgi:hypothetical protein